MNHNAKNKEPTTEKVNQDIISICGQLQLIWIQGRDACLERNKLISPIGWQSYLHKLNSIGDTSLPITDHHKPSPGPGHLDGFAWSVSFTSRSTRLALISLEFIKERTNFVDRVDSGSLFWAIPYLLTEFWRKKLGRWGPLYSGWVGLTRSFEEVGTRYVRRIKNRMLINYSMTSLCTSILDQYSPLSYPPLRRAFVS